MYSSREHLEFTLYFYVLGNACCLTWRCDFMLQAFISRFTFLIGVSNMWGDVSEVSLKWSGYPSTRNRRWLTEYDS